MKVLSFDEMHKVQGTGTWTWAGSACAVAVIGTAAVVGSGPLAPGVATLVGWGLGHAWGSCLGLTYISATKKSKN